MGSNKHLHRPMNSLFRKKPSLQYMYFYICQVRWFLKFCFNLFQKLWQNHTSKMTQNMPHDFFCKLPTASFTMLSIDKKKM